MALGTGPDPAPAMAGFLEISICKLRFSQASTTVTHIAAVVSSPACQLLLCNIF